MPEEIENIAAQENIQPQESKMTMKQKSRIVIMTLLGIVLITFVVQNLGRADIKFLNMNFRIRKIFIILGSAAIGASISFLLMKHGARKNRKKK